MKSTKDNLIFIGMYTEDILYNILFNKFIKDIISGSEDITELDDEYLTKHISKVLDIEEDSILLVRTIENDKNIIKIYLKKFGI